MLSNILHNHQHSKLLTRVRKRSAVVIFMAFAIFFAVSQPEPTELCNNKLDDDLDGLVDCKDPDCKAYLELCSEALLNEKPEE